MNRVALTGICLLLFSGAMAQGPSKDSMAILPVKNGTVLEYDVNANGQLMPLTMKIFLTDDGGLGFEFNVAELNGKFINSKESLEKASTTNWDEPTPGEERKLAADQTIAVFSRTFLKELKQNKKATYDGVNWLLKDQAKDPALVLDSKAKLDAIYIESENGLTKYWLLNNDDYPIMLKVDGNQKGPDLILRNIR